MRQDRRRLKTNTLVETEIGPKPSDYLSSLSRLHEARGGLSHLELDHAAFRLRDVVISAVLDELRSLGLPSAISHEVKGSDRPLPLPDNEYRQTVAQVASAIIEVKSAPPANARAQHFASVQIVLDNHAYFAFRVLSSVPDLRPLDVRLSDVHPDLTSAFDRIIRSWSKRLLADVLAEVSKQGQESLRASGYTQ